MSEEPDITAVPDDAPAAEGQGADEPEAAAPAPWPSDRIYLALFGALLALAVLTRLWDVGGRALHYDEILHAWYAWLYAEGSGYAHTPVTHGPFLFHATAGVFKVLGSNDALARGLPALFGVALIGLPFLLRRELGRAGSLATSALLLLSPSVLYFSRFIRNDVFMAVWAIALLVVMWRYMERPRFRLLFAWVVLWALAFTTKETSYFLAPMFGLGLFVMSYRHIWGWVRGRVRLSDLPPAGSLLLVLVTVTLPLWAPLSGLFQDLIGVVLVNPDGNDPRVASGEVFRAAVETGAPAGGAQYIAGMLVLLAAGLAVTVGLVWDHRRWPFLALIFIAIWLMLFTSIFTNWQGFFTGLWGSLGYWMAQQPVERADQPWFYYLIGLVNYEFLIAIPALIGGVYLLTRRRAFDAFIVYWAAASLAAGMVAGERMPWLLFGIVVPMSLVAGKAIGWIIEVVRDTLEATKPAVAYDAGGPYEDELEELYQRPRWRRLQRAQLIAFGSGLALLGLIAIALLNIAPTSTFLSALPFWIPMGAAVVVLVVIGVTMRLSRPLPVLASASLGILAVLVVLTALASGRASYSYAGFERPNELLVYSQTGQESSYAGECIDRLAEQSGLGRGLRVLAGEADNNAWQWRWYLRDYPGVTYRVFSDAPLTEPPDAQVVVVSVGDEGLVSGQLDGFTRVGGVTTLWWFPNWAYKHTTPGDVLAGLTSRASWQTATDYFFAREFAGDLYRSNAVVYVADSLAHLAAGCTDLRAYVSA